MKEGGRRKTAGPPIHAARKDRDEDLLLFHEMLRRDRERIASLLLPVSDDFEPNQGNHSLFRIPSGKKGHELLNVGNEKNDYDWLKTPPATPLFPSLEMEAAGPHLVIQREIPIIQPAKFSRFSVKAEAPGSTHPADTKSKPKSAASPRSVTPNPKSRAPSTVNPISALRDKPTKSVSDPTDESTVPKKKPANSKDTSSTKHGRGVSPVVRSRVPSTLPGFSKETPPNLRTPGRSSSASRSRPSNQVPADSKTEKVDPRRQSCSPSVTRGRRSESKQESEKGKAHAGDGGMIFGSRMVEKVMNARKAAVIEDEDPGSRFRGSAGEISGLGKMMGRSSLDVALKHTDLKRNSTKYFVVPMARDWARRSSNGT